MPQMMKMKLGFIDGSFPRPSPVYGSSTSTIAWRRAVYVSLGTKMKLGFIDGSFLRPSPGSANFELWRRGSNAPALKCKCGGCSCGINKAVDDLTSSTQVMQFLMGLHDSFNNERSQILMLDPLPDIEKTFSMVYAVEEQRAVQADLEANSSHLAYQLALNKNRKPGGNKFVQQKKLFIDKKNLVCTNCHKKGHARDTCFRLHGVPDWYKSLGDKNKKGKAFTATVDVHNEELTKNSSYNVVEIVAEVMKMMQKTTMPSDPLTNYANYAQFDGEFAGATNHVCGNIALFNSYAEPTHSHYVHLPDGSKRTRKLEITWSWGSSFDGHASAEAIKHIQDFDCKDGVSDKPCDTCHRAKE
ncbi:UNVERIFIED_CONTAM: hypothetical protein Sangu_3132800 [Sesamum angustifolium]|uniref:Uncharacterized protein n=1 Tax=Sesamum angustifolium TaxID=2727405 RepID=A0AAW2K1K6_9LAMI